MNNLRMIVSCIALVAILSAGPVESSFAASEVRLEDGRLSGQAVSQSEFWITVRPGEPVTGSFGVRTLNEMGPGAVAPLGYTVTWGDRRTQPVEVEHWIGTGWNEYRVNVNEIAPREPGDYYIIVAFGGRYDVGEVMSSTSAGASSVWHDGNDLGWDWNASQFREARESGKVTTRLRKPNGDLVTGTAPATWVGVHVRNDHAEQGRDGAGAELTRPITQQSLSWYTSTIRQTIEDDQRLAQLDHAFRAAVEIRDTVAQTKRDVAYGTLQKIGGMRIQTSEGKCSLEEFAREKILAQAPALAGSDLVEEPATVVAAMLISDREYFLHDMRIVQLDGQYMSISQALEQRSGVDPALTRELISAVEAADALSRGEDLLTNLESLTVSLEQIDRIAQYGRSGRVIDDARNRQQGTRDAGDRDRARRERESTDQQRKREEAAQRAEQERLNREAAERREAERQATDRDRALREKARRHPWGLAGETVDQGIRRDLKLYPGTNGVVVRFVQPGSIADQSGIHAGAVIESISHRVIADAAALEDWAMHTRSGDQFPVGTWERRGNKWERATRMMRIP